MAFVLHPRLEEDTHFVTDFTLCRVLLMDDVRYPWLILVPRIPSCREIHALTQNRQYQLIDESSRASQCLEALFEIEKINVAALGNLVPQLHLHHVGRRQDDPAWPGPVWGHSPPEKYSDTQLSSVLGDLRQKLEN